MVRANSNFFRHHLVDELLQKVRIPATGESILQILERGGVKVTDVGCGCGASTVAMVRRFPKSYFYAYESSAQCLQILRERAADLPNIETSLFLFSVTGELLPPWNPE